MADTPQAVLAGTRPPTDAALAALLRSCPEPVVVASADTGRAVEQWRAERAPEVAR